MEGSGATLPSRDSVDQRIVAQLRSGTGHLLKSPDEAGPRPDYPAAFPPADSDGDGMPDEWESRHGIDANKRNSSLEDTDGDGYMDIEEYLNGTDPRAPQPWVFPPAISPPDGSLVAGQATVTLVSATEGARIHYTLDGSDPQVNSPRYTQPFSVSRTSTIRARRDVMLDEQK